MINIITNLFPLWAVLLSIAAFVFPNLFTSLKSFIIPLLTIVMFGMGMTLTWNNFREVLKSPNVILLGVSLQFVIMPLTAFLISKTLGFGPELIAGMILVGSSPGGTASNVITYLAKGNVALSITLTSVSTLLAVAATPMLSYLYLNQIVDVPVMEMLVDVLQIVLIPVLAGTVINTYFGRKMVKFQPAFPLISVLSIVLIIAIIMGLNRDRLFDIGALVVIGVIMHNSAGLFFGYMITKLFKYNKSTCRTIAIEVGMQNSGLAVALAIKFYSITAALPGAVFSIWHNLSGSLLAAWWSRHKKPRR